MTISKYFVALSLILVGVLAIETDFSFFPLEILTIMLGVVLIGIGYKLFLE